MNDAENLTQELLDCSTQPYVGKAIVIQSTQEQLSVLLWNRDDGKFQVPALLTEADRPEEHMRQFIRDTLGLQVDFQLVDEARGGVRAFAAAVDPGYAHVDVRQATWVPVDEINACLAESDAALVRVATDHIVGTRHLLHSLVESCPEDVNVQLLLTEAAPRLPGSGTLIELPNAEKAAAVADDLRVRSIRVERLDGSPSEAAQANLDRIRRRRQLTPVNEALIRSSDLLHTWENKVQPLLAAGTTVLVYPWINEAKAACIRRGLSPSICEVIFRWDPGVDLKISLDGQYNGT